MWSLQIKRAPSSCRKRILHSRASSGQPASHANKALPQASPRQAPRIVVIDSVTGFRGRTLTQVASLLSAAFYTEEEEAAWQHGIARADGPAAALRAALFGWASLLAVLLQHVTYGSRHLTLLALVDEQVVGCCGLTIQAAPPDVLAATDTAPGTMYGLLTGLAVAPAQRRRGVGTELLTAAAAEAAVAEVAAAAATAARRPPPAMLALLVSRTNIPALRLYSTQGYEEQAGWVDARWLEEAERGKVGKPRRLLLMKRLP